MSLYANRRKVFAFRRFWHSVVRQSHHRNTRRPNRAHGGFILLLVVVTLLIASLALYRYSSAVLQDVREVISREKQLREDWTIKSARIATLRNAAELLQAQQPTPGSGVEPQTSLFAEVNVNENLVTLRLEDESAKLSVPHVYRSLPPQARRSTVENSLSYRLAAPSIDWRRLEQPGFERLGWQSVFGGDSPLRGDALLGLDSSIVLRANDDLTLWGDGRLNVYRAPPRILDAAWKGVFGSFPPRELLEMRNVWPRPSWQEVLRSLDLRESELQRAEEWFRTSSQTFTLELSLQNQALRTGRRVYLFVASPDMPAGFRLD